MQRKVVDFDSGIAMVVTDLHGEGAIYDHLRRKFLTAHAKGEVDRLIICGDLIHGRSGNEDHSLRMILDLMHLQATMGKDKVVMLLGNHEFPHIYNITLQKGGEEFTEPFERMLTQTGKRDEVYAFLRALPFYARTKAGVTLTHAGGTSAILTAQDAENLFTFDHDALLHLGEDILRRNVDMDLLKADKKYVQQAMKYLALTGINDPRLPNMMRGQIISQTLEQEFDFLWDVLFAQNEQSGSVTSYNMTAIHFLQAVSQSCEWKQRVIVAGHIATRGGHKLVGSSHLRVASYTHAQPNQAGEYLLLDCGEPIQAAAELIPHLRQTIA
jgi:hypothetical protein